MTLFGQDRFEIDGDRLEQEFGPVDGHKRRNTVPISVSREWTQKASHDSRRPEP